MPSFEFSLRERVARLAEFRHPYFARIRKVDRLSDERGTVALMSDCAPGTRLVEILAAVERSGPVLSLDAALSLVRQLSSALTLLHDHTQVSHGAVAVERLIITPNARLFVVEHVIGAALEQLRYSRERYWNELRVALPMSVGLPHFDQRADLAQLGTVALSLILGRRLADDEYPGGIEDLIASASARAADGSREQLPTELRDWLRRTLQLDTRHSYTTLAAAQTALEQMLSAEGRFNADVSAVEEFLTAYQASPKPAGSSMPVEQPVAKPSVATVPSVMRIEPPSSAFSPVTQIEEDDEEEEDATAADDETDSNDASEWQPAASRRMMAAGFVRYKWVALGLVIALAAGGAVFGARRMFSAAPVVPTGAITIDTSPTAGQVEVDGVARGTTPLRLSLPAGAHVLTVRGEGKPRVIPITIKADTEISQYVELPAAAAATGQVQIRSEPSGARVTVDGISHGITPLTVAELAPGEHTVKVDSDVATVTQAVVIEAGITASLVVPMSATQVGPASGWVSISAPFAMDLYEQGRMLGNSGIDRIMMAAGKHDIEISNEPLGFREMRTVQVTPGKLTVISVTLPKGTLSLNAVPWANVVIDGESVGETPIGNLSLPIGPHEVVFRNPQLGEQRRVIVVNATSPVRFSIDMAKK
ncbi:MAG: PEGA domain-containing protein [Vicinamibacterales bacterium]|nr:PEGA domain-containing protein [Vicinamibacterales bacterium]